MVSKAVAAVKAELPDIPVWKGTTFTGTVVDATTVCVDRTYPPGGGIDGKGGSAGYVMVSFPEVKPGEPQDGTCKEAKPSASASSAAPVAVPDAMKDRAGLVTRDDLGDEWPLTVDYGVLACVPKEAGGYNLKLASFEAPNGTKYALNGQAKSHLSLPAIDPIWAQNPSASGLKKNISPLLDRALDMC